MFFIFEFVFSLQLTARATRRPGFLKLIFSSHFTKIAQAAKDEIGAARFLLTTRTFFSLFLFSGFYRACRVANVHSIRVLSDFY
jgi:hypothetical protein